MLLHKVDANRVLPLVWTRIEHKTLGTNPCNTDNWFHSTSARAMPDLGMQMKSVPQEHHLYSQIWYDNRRCNIQELLTTEASWFPGPVRHPTGSCRVFRVLPPVQEGSVEAGAERLLAQDRGDPERGQVRRHGEGLARYRSFGQFRIFTCTRSFSWSEPDSS